MHGAETAAGMRRRPTETNSARVRLSISLKNAKDDEFLCRQQCARRATQARSITNMRHSIKKFPTLCAGICAPL